MLAENSFEVPQDSKERKDIPKKRQSQASRNIYESWRWQPHIKLDRLNQQTVDLKHDGLKKMSIDGSNEGDSLINMTPNYIQDMLTDDRAVLGRTKKRKWSETSSINCDSWIWQPYIKLDRLIQKNLENHNRQKIQRVSFSSDVKQVNLFVQFPTIEFDSYDTLIRELSPKTATERFQQRLKNIKNSIQPSQIGLNNVKKKRTRKRRTLSTELLEYEELHKRVQEKKPEKRSKGLFRKLYNPNDSFDKNSEKENYDIQGKQK